MTICPECNNEYSDVIEHIEKDHQDIKKSFHIPTLSEIPQRSKMSFMWRGIRTMVEQLSKSDKKSISAFDERLLGYGLNQVSIKILRPLFEKKMTRKEMSSYLSGQHQNIPEVVQRNILEVWEIIPDSEFGAEPEEVSDIEDYEKIKEENDNLRFELNQMRSNIRLNPHVKHEKPVILTNDVQDEEVMDKSPHQTLILKNVKIDSKNVGSVITEFFTSRECCISKIDYSLEKPFTIEFIVPKKNTWVMIQKIEKNAFIESYEELKLI